jgi:uncharacterized membrane protein
MEKSEQTHHEPSKRRGLTVGQRAADSVSNFVGSWKFIIIFISFLVVWMSVNVFALSTSWDPYPFILLNLTLSSIAALHAPIIMMSQNRQAERDRIRNEYDFAIDKKAEREIEEIQVELKTMQKKLDTLISRETGAGKRLKKNST